MIPFLRRCRSRRCRRGWGRRGTILPSVPPIPTTASSMAATQAAVGGRRIQHGRRSSFSIVAREEFLNDVQKMKVTRPTRHHISPPNTTRSPYSRPHCRISCTCDLRLFHWMGSSPFRQVEKTRIRRDVEIKCKQDRETTYLSAPGISSFSRKSTGD